MKKCGYLIKVVAFALPMAANGAQANVHCVQGQVRNNSAYQQLWLRYTNSKLNAIAYDNEMGPGVSGDFYGCAIDADRLRRAKNEPIRVLSWFEAGTTTKINLALVSSSTSVDAELMVEDAGDRVVTTFDIKNMAAFCGMQSALPSKVTYYKLTKTCVFDGPDL